MKYNNIKSRITALLFGMAVIACQQAYAINANPRAVKVKQPDGSTLTIRIHGDENRHYISTTDGHRIVKDKDGFYKYLTLEEKSNTLVLSRQRASNPSERSAAEAEFVRTLDNTDKYQPASPVSRKAPATTLHPAVLNPTAPGSGEFMRSKGKAAPGNESQYLCILVNFKDARMKFKRDDFDNFLNQSNYAGWGSVKDYYRDNSNGKFIPNFTTLGIYTLSKPQSEYAGNDDTGSDANPRGMVVEAVQMAKEANPSIDFSKFDNDGDGYMDNCYIIYAGYSEASTGNTGDMWPHSWTLGNDTITVDGIIVKNYSCSQELVGSPGFPVTPAMDGIGTFTHEFGHILGLKDMYDTDNYYNGYGLDPGDYNLFASGSYNNDSKTPAALWAFERMQLGWMEKGKDIIELKAAEDVTQQNSTSTFTARYIDCQPGRAEGTGFEWFMVENRQKTGWDSFIPNHGMLIYHYDYTADMKKDYWDINGPNNNARHRCLYIMPADGIDDGNSRNGDTFPGLSANTSFTDATTPRAVNWTGEPINVPITNIREDNGVIYYQVSGGTTTWNVIKTERPAWVHDVEVTMAATVVSHTGSISEMGFCWAEGRVCPTLSNDHAAVAVADNIQHSVGGLKTGTIYSYRSYMKLTDGTVVYGSPMEFKTEYATAYAPFTQDFKKWEDGMPDAWEIVDRNGDGTTWIEDNNSSSICYQFDYWNNADDWLISKRRYHIPENGALYFERGVNEENYVETVEIYVSTKTSDINDFYLHKRISIADQFGMKVWEEVDLSQYAGKDIYVAIRCCSENMQGLLRIWNVRLEQRLDKPEVTYFGKGDNDEQIRVAWTPVNNAAKYYLYFGKVTSQTYMESMFCPVDYFAKYSRDVEFGTGHIFFKGSGFVELKKVAQGYEDLKFLVMASGPSGTSYLDIEGTTDGVNWAPVCPRVTLYKYDTDGIECDFSQYVKGRGYISFRFNFTDGGRLAHVRYLTLSYYDGFAWSQLAAGSVRDTSRNINASKPDEFKTGKYVTWVAAGTEDNLFFDESDYVFYTVTEPSKGTSGIDDAIIDSSAAGSTVVYNLSGQRINAPAKGIYIQNGKKIAVKN